MEMRWKISYRAVYEKFKDGTVKDISDELPFEIPNGWAWVRLESLGFYHGGHTPSMSEPSFWGGNILWVSAKDMKCDVIIDTQDKITHKGAAVLQMVNVDSLVLVTRSGILKHTFPVAIVKTPCTINQDLKAFIPYCTEVTQYLALCLRALQAVILKRYRKKGMTVQSIVWESFIRMPIPLPPLSEQKRIVAKIEKLMPLVEEYGKMEETRLQLDADLPAMLEKSILQEAIQGKLVPQDPNDEPASELLKRIAAERKALVKAGKLKRDKGESVIFRGSDRLAYETRNGETVCIQDEIPFDIPDSWEWVRLGDMSNYGQCKSVDTTDIAPDTWSLDLEEIEKGTGRLIERKTAADKKSKSSKHVFTKGTLLYSKLRTYLNKVLVADMDGVCTSEIVPIELNGGVNAEYVRLVLMSPYFLEYTASKGYGIKMPRVGTDDMKQSLIPLPPLDEQKRIVKRVEELKGTARTLVTF